MQRGYISRKKLLIFVLVLLTLVLGYFIVNEVIKKPICVSRTVTGDLEKNVQLDIEVSKFKGPKSFIIEEKMPSGAVLVDSNPKELFNQDGRISWLFWNGGLKAESRTISYVLSNITGENVYGRLFVALDKKDPSKGYSETVIALGRVCI